ncbi:MAG: DnaD domain protein [Caldilineaceae bacterium]|nr:DnaD domain protein [Caldilineaceae bacterium]
MASNPHGFIGFPDIQMKPVVIPDHFFTELLPQIDDLAELKLTLHCFWLLNEQTGELRYLRGADLRADATLLQSLTLDSDLRTPQQALEEALQRAVARNTLLKLEIETDADGPGGAPPPTRVETPAKIQNPESKIDDWYFVNTAKGRQTLALIRQGKLKELQAAIPDEARLRVQRPNVYVLYEQNIGLLTPLLAEQLRDMEKTYPPAWVEEAFEIAVSRNRRHLRYIQNILKRWATEGKEGDRHEESGPDAEGKRRRSYLPDEFSDIILG